MTIDILWPALFNLLVLFLAIPSQIIVNSTSRICTGKTDLVFKIRIITMFENKCIN